MNSCLQGNSRPSSIVNIFSLYTLQNNNKNFADLIKKNFVDFLILMKIFVGGIFLKC